MARARKAKVLESTPGATLPAKITKTIPTKSNASVVAAAAEGKSSAAAATVTKVSAAISSALKITESDIISSSSPQQLVDIINKLTSTTQDEIFLSYKTQMEAQLAESHKIINELQQDIIAKNTIIDSLQVNNKNNATSQTPSRASQNVYKSPIRRKKNESTITQDQLSKELETIGITLDMLELLTGLRIVNYEEDDVKFHFDITQTSTAEAVSEGTTPNGLTINYRLIISKEFKSTAEINYVPTFLKDDDENSEKLREILPEYFCDNLTFPYNTLSQFYTKINRALNKGVKW